MKKYHKIQTVFKRDNPHSKKVIIGNWSLLEFEYLQNNTWVFDEKIDGMNIRISYKDGLILFDGKTDDAMIPAKLVNRLNQRFLNGGTMSDFQKIFPGNADVCLYGEGYGAGIQTGGNYRHDQGFILFDVNIDGWWLGRDDVNDIANKISIEVVPVIGEGTLQEMVAMVKGGLVSIFGDFIGEGIVARPKVEFNRRNGDRIITKIKCKDF